MHNELQFILSLAVAFGIALLGGYAAHALRLSPLVGYLVAGMAIGPLATGAIGNQKEIASLSEIGVIFLMFVLGIEFSLKDLARAGIGSLLGTLGQMLLLIGAGFLFGRVLGWSWQASLYFGSVICISSTMVILKTLMSRGEMTSPHGRLLLAMLIVQDLAVVLLMLVLPRLTTGGAMEWAPLLLLLLKGAVFIAGTLFFGTRVVPPLIEKIERLQAPELSILTAASLALGTAAVSGWLELSPALGAFMAGLLLTETEFDHHVMARIGPMRDLFATLFFVSVGMLIDVRFIISHLPQMLVMSVFLVLAKGILTMLALAPFRSSGKTLTFVGCGMIPLGEFNFVLAGVGHHAGALSNDIYNLILASSLPTIVLTPLALGAAPRLTQGLSALPVVGRRFGAQVQVLEPQNQASKESDEGSVPENHAVVIGYGRVGRRVARGLRRSGVPVTVIEGDWTMLEQVREAGFPAVYGDASYPTVLRAAMVGAARLVVVALPDFGATRAVVHRINVINPNVIIVARAQRAEDDVKLRAAGATAVVAPELAGALMLLDETLMLIGLPASNS